LDQKSGFVSINSRDIKVLSGHGTACMAVSLVLALALSTLALAAMATDSYDSDGASAGTDGICGEGVLWTLVEDTTVLEYPYGNEFNEVAGSVGYPYHEVGYPYQSGSDIVGYSYHALGYPYHEVGCPYQSGSDVVGYPYHALGYPYHEVGYPYQSGSDVVGYPYQSVGIDL